MNPSFRVAYKTYPKGGFCSRRLNTFEKALRYAVDHILYGGGVMECWVYQERPDRPGSLRWSKCFRVDPQQVQQQGEEAFLKRFDLTPAGT